MMIDDRYRGGWRRDPWRQTTENRLTQTSLCHKIVFLDNTIIVILVIIVTTQHYQQYAKGKRDTEWTNPSASA
jgi:hypothetical protein